MPFAFRRCQTSTAAEGAQRNCFPFVPGGRLFVAGFPSSVQKENHLPNTEYIINEISYTAPSRIVTLRNVPCHYLFNASVENELVDILYFLACSLTGKSLICLQGQSTTILHREFSTFRLDVYMVGTPDATT